MPYDSVEEPKKNPVKRSSKPGTLEITRTTEPDGRNTRKPKGQDPERPSNLAFESTKDPYHSRYRDRETTGERNMKPRDFRAKTEIKQIITVGARKLPAGGALLNVDRSSDVNIWKAVSSAEKQMHFPRCLKNPFEERL